MILTAKIWQEGRFWLIACDALDAMTQGQTKKEALAMMIDWIRVALDDPRYDVQLSEPSKGEIHLKLADPKPILGLMIDRMREAAGLTYEEVAQRVGIKSRSGIKTMASGKHDPRFGKMARVMKAMGYEVEVRVVRVGE